VWGGGGGGGGKKRCGWLGAKRSQAGTQHKRPKNVSTNKALEKKKKTEENTCKTPKTGPGLQLQTGTCEKKYQDETDQKGIRGGGGQKKKKKGVTTKNVRGWGENHEKIGGQPETWTPRGPARCQKN